MATPDLPQFTATVPEVAIPQGTDIVADRVSQFGNIVQNFTQKTTEYAGNQIGLKEKATEMVLKTNIDNAMRGFARSSTNMFDPKAGIANFEQQSDEYISTLLEGSGGIHADTIRAYAAHAKVTNLQPLHAAAVKQAFNETRMNFFQSIENFQKDLSQSINLVPMEDAVSHHTSKETKPAGQIEAGNIDLTERPKVKNPDGSISTVRSITIEADGKHYVIPTIAETGVLLEDEEAIALWQQTGQHLGVFDSRKAADNFAEQLHQSEAKKLTSPQNDEPQQQRNAPSIDAIQYNLSQALNQIDTAIRTGIISPTQGVKLKDKLTGQVNDEMLYHKYQMAVEMGQGEAFIQSYAKSQSGRAGAATFAKHIAEFKKIEMRNLAEQAINEQTARSFMSDNLKNLELGKQDNTYADSLAAKAPTLFPTYSRDKQIAELSGGLYKQFTSGTQSQSLNYYSQLREMNGRKEIDDETRAINNQALETAFKNADTYFKELKADPQKFLLEKNMLGDIAQQQKINGKNGILLPDDLKLPNASTLESTIELQRLHGIPSNQASLLTNVQAEEFGANLLKAAPSDKVKMIQSIARQYGKYSSNVMQQLIKNGSVPREYGWFTSLNPDSGTLPDMVDAITNNTIKYTPEQKSEVKLRVDKAMNIAAERAHPDVSNARRFLGMAYQSARGLVTGREFDAAATNTGLFGTPALFDNKSTTPDVKLKALTESFMGISGYNTGELINTIDTTVNKLTNYYIQMRGLSVDDALAQSVRALTDQYEMVDYRDNIVRLPRNRINFNDVNILFSQTPELVNKIEWQYPMIGDFGSKASRTDQVNFFKQNIENGHWATDPTNQGLMWVNANGMVNKMKNGNPLYISFESLQKMQRLDLNPSSFLGSPESEGYLNTAYQLFRQNGVDFNHQKMGIENPDDIKVSQIPSAFTGLEKMTNVAVTKSREMYEFLFADMQEKQRRLAAKKGVK